MMVLVQTDEEMRRVIAKLDYWATDSSKEENKRSMDVVQILFEKAKGSGTNKHSIEENIQYSILFGKFHVFIPPLLVLNKDLKMSLRKVIAQVSPPSSNIAYIQSGNLDLISIHEEVNKFGCSVTYFASKVCLKKFMLSPAQEPQSDNNHEEDSVTVLSNVALSHETGPVGTGQGDGPGQGLDARHAGGVREGTRTDQAGRQRQHHPSGGPVFPAAAGGALHQGDGGGLAQLGVHGKKRLSDVFVEEDDPLVIQIIARERKEAEKLAARAKVTTDGRRRESMEKMAQYCQNISKLESSQGSSVQLGPKTPKLKKLSNNNSVKKSRILYKKEESSQVSVYNPTIEELLRIPDRPEDGRKTMEEVLDELDVVIAERSRKHEEEMLKVDKEIDEEKSRQEEKTERFIQNGLLKDRLREEVTEEEIRIMFASNLQYLKEIQAGKEESSRHTAYHQSGRARHALYYTMITSPFSDEQLDWTLDEISKVWMRTKKEQMDNNEYCWKVILAECLIKFFMDKFQVNKKEAEKCIAETPLDSEDDDDGGEELEVEEEIEEAEDSYDGSLYC